MHQTNPYWLVSQAPEDLKSQIRLGVQYGYHVTSQTDTTAQLFRNKQFSFLFAVLWFFCFGIGLLIYLFYYAAKKDDAIYLDLSTQPTKESLALQPKKTNWQQLSMGKKVLYGFLIFFAASIVIGFVGDALDGANNNTETAVPSQQVVSAETIKPLLKEEIESIKIFDGESMRKLQKERKQSPALELFERWGSLVEEGKKSTDKETVDLAKTLEQQASTIQAKEFPLMRKLTAEQFKEVLWSKDTDVNVSGTRNDALEFVSATFARNQNILDFYSPISESLKRLRFRSAAFRWVDGADGTRFNHAQDADFPKDSDVVPRAK